MEAPLAPHCGIGVAGISQAAAAVREIEQLQRNREQVSVEGESVLQSEATENSGTSRAGSVTSLSGFAAGFTMSGYWRYSSRRCLPAARRAAVSAPSGKFGTRRTTASEDFSARIPAPVSTPHLRRARANRNRPARARILPCRSIENREKTPLFALGSAPR